ncbi:MAG: PadR family transcriptional regulator [Phycisphaerales bacterium JB039]
MARLDPGQERNELVVLSVLQEAEQYGYAISRTVAARSDGELRLTPGALYPLLARLEKQGLIASRAEEVRSDRAEPGARGRTRKWYSLTAKGRKRLAKRIEAHRAQVRLMESFIAGSATEAEAG